MKQVIYYILPLAASLIFSSCGGKTQAEKNREEAEREGASYLTEARKYLSAEDYVKARQRVEALRAEQPLALDSRRQAILLLDSIELLSSSDSVRFAEGEEWERLNLKLQFYQRKLKEDIKAYGEK